MLDKKTEEWKYALVLCTSSSMEIIQKYPNTEQLETGYRDWKKFASDRNITKPVPVERDSEGNYRILIDIFNTGNADLN